MAKSKVKTQPDAAGKKESSPLASHTIQRKLPSYEESDQASQVDQTFADHCKPRTVPELVALMESNPNIQMDARVFFLENGTGNARLENLNRDKFIEAFKSNKKRSIILCPTVQL